MYFTIVNHASKLPELVCTSGHKIGGGSLLHTSNTHLSPCLQQILSGPEMEYCAALDHSLEMKPSVHQLLSTLVTLVQSWTLFLALSVTEGN